MNETFEQNFDHSHQHLNRNKFQSIALDSLFFCVFRLLAFDTSVLMKDTLMKDESAERAEKIMFSSG